ncbi:MAG: extracellular solute-binding protein [Treponemataceae bacterium]
MKKRLIGFFAISLMLFSGVLSFAGGSKEAASPGKSTKLTMWVFNALHATFYKDALERWNKEFPNRKIDLTVEEYPNNEMHNKLLLSFQSGVGAPDLVDININYFSNFMKGQIQLVPLNKIVDPVRDKFIQSRFDIYTKDGKVYGLPTHVGATVVYYNKEIMDKAGVDFNKIVTWDDYIAAGKQVVAKTGVPMTSFEVIDQRPFWPMIVQRGGDYLDKNGKVVLDSEINIKTLQAMLDMIVKDKIAIEMPGGATGREEFWPFMNKGGQASLIMPMWFMSRFLNYMPDLKGKIYVRPMPIWEKGDKRSAGIGGTGTSVTTQSKNQDIAVDFLAYAKLSRESNIKLWTILRFDPPRWDVWNSPELQTPDPYFGNEAVFKTLLGFKDEIVSPNNALLSSPAQDAVRSQVMFKVLKERSMTPEAALKASAAELRKLQ